MTKSQFTTIGKLLVEKTAAPAATQAANTTALLKRSSEKTFAAILAAKPAPTTHRFTMLADHDEGDKIIDAISSSADFKQCGALKNITRRSPKCIAIEVVSTQQSDCIKRIAMQKDPLLKIQNTHFRNKFQAKI